MGNLDKKRKLESELVSNKHLSIEEREELEKERLRILEKLRLKTLRNKKNRKARLQKAEQFMINHTVQRSSRICYLSKQHLMINFVFFYSACASVAIVKTSLGSNKEHTLFAPPIVEQIIRYYNYILL